VRQKVVNLPISKEIDGYEAQFLPDPRIQNYHEFQTEAPYIRKILEDARNDDVFYDIGANIGIYSCFLGHKCANVFAFEPSPIPFEYLIKNSKLNSGIEGHQVVISDEDGTVEFSVDKSDHFGRMSSMNSSDEDVEYKSIEIESSRLDSFIDKEGLPKPDLVKIDVEGAELKVLKGLEQTMPAPRNIYCEIHHHRLEDFSSTSDEIHDVLTTNGYNVEVLHERNGTEFVKATTR
jgi:FkbM family methyltransferase